MDPVLRTLLLERLEASELDGEAKRVIEVACDGGRRSRRSGAAPPVWLSSVTVEGFRGIGARATLPLEPSPGLTVVVGRNGSGQVLVRRGPGAADDRAAEALGEAPEGVDGDLAVPALRRADADRARRSCSRARGRRSSLTQEWPHGAPYDDASGRAEPAAVLAPHGWDRDLPSFRPFLAYAELATMFDTLLACTRR